jgi:hypothetical protein
MLQDDRNKLNRIEELKTKLFSKTSSTQTGHRDNLSHLHTGEVPASWTEKGGAFREASEQFFMKTSLFKKFFLFSVGFFALALGYASYMFFAAGNSVSNENIEIAILGNAFTAGGEELPLQISITNKNNSALDLVDLVVEYPKSSSGDLSSETERIRESLGSIPAGAMHNENVKIIIFGEQNSVRPIRVFIEYRVEGSNAIFVKEKFHEVTINSTPINLSVEAPATASPNQDITLKVKAALNATNPAGKILLRIDYPIGFQFVNANPKPSYGNNVWDLGDLAPGAERDIDISGKMLDVYDGEEKIFHIWSGSQSSTDKSVIGVVFNSIAQAIAIRKSSIQAQLYVNNIYAREYATDARTPVYGEIHWANNLDTNINDLEIRAKITGNAVNRKTISAKLGFFNSSKDEIVWDKNSTDTFREVSPGDSGVVTFSVLPLALLSGSDGMLVDPSIKIEVSISGKQALSGYEFTDLSNSESAVVKVISDVGFAAKGLFYSGSFKNTGPIPPKVEEETTYTVVWSLSNTANNVSKGIVKSSLPSWVDFGNKISPPSEDLTFNASTKEITWNVGNIPKGTGISSPSREVAFSIILTPSLSQVGSSPTLVNDAVLTGHDDFANVNIRVVKTSLTTRLPNDSSMPAGGDRVEE